MAEYIKYPIFLIGRMAEYIKYPDFFLIGRMSEYIKYPIFLIGRMEKAQAVLGALRERTEVMDGKAERTLSALAVCDAPRAQELYQLGLRVQDPTISEKSFRRVQTA